MYLEEEQTADPSESLRGWDLGMAYPETRKRTVFVPGKAHCSACGAAISDHHWRLFRTCNVWKCRNEHRLNQGVEQRDRDEHKRRQWEEYESRLRKVRDQAASLSRIDQPDRFVPAVIPAMELTRMMRPERRWRIWGMTA